MSLVARAALAALALVAAPGVASAVAPPTRVYTISIGQNEVPAHLSGGASEALVTLHYADDDAATFHTFMRASSQAAYLLSVLDADTQQRFPGLVGEARVPTLSELSAVVEKVRRAMEEDRSAGRDPVLVLFYSGHGVRDREGVAGLAMQDGALGQDRLYQRILATLPARLVHLVVDACHAEAVVRPRDIEGRVEMLPADELRAAIETTTLARFPHVGALLASTSSAQSFEWDAYRGGVFAHEVLSGLRGAADVNGDGRIEYSELAAFLAAANLQIPDVRARPQIVVQPPRVDRRAAIVDLGRAAGQFRLTGRASGGWSAPLYVETESGIRVADLHIERDGAIALRLPADERLYLVRPDGEVEITGRAGAVVPIDGLPSPRPRARARGALDTAMRRGLFGAAFGTAFYRGYISQQQDLVPVDFSNPDAVPSDLPADTGPEVIAGASGSAAGGGQARRTIGRALLVGGAVAAAAAGVFGGLALYERSQYNGTDVERTATEARDRYATFGWLGIGSAAGAALLAGVGFALLPSRPAASDAPPSAPALVFTGSGLAVTGRF